MKKLNGTRAGLAIMVGAGLLLMAGCGGNNPYEKQELSYRTAGIRLLSEGNYTDAAKAFQNALDHANGRITEVETDICFYKAKALKLEGKSKEAQKVYDALLSYDSHDTRAYYLKGVLELEQGKYKQGYRDFKQALKETPDDYELYFAVYQNLISVKMKTEAKAIIQKGLTIGGTEAENYCGRGRIYLLMGETDNARTNLDQAINKGSEPAKLYMAQLLEQTGEKERAFSIYESYAQKHKDDAQAQNKIAGLLMEQGEYEKALEYYKKSLTLTDGEERQKAEKGIVFCLEEKREFEKAAGYAEEYLKNNPEDAQMKRELIFLKTR